MKTLSYCIVSFVFALLSIGTQAQEKETAFYQEEIETLKKEKEQIATQEKEALKIEIHEITKRLEAGDITKEKAKELKEAAAKKRALNIENRIAIIDNKIALLDRNEGVVLTPKDSVKSVQFSINFGRNKSRWYEDDRWKDDLKYDRRTYSYLTLATGLNNAIIEGQSLEDSPYKVGGSRFFEIGWTWHTRVLKNSNFLRVNYGLSLQYNGLKPKGNQYFELNDEGQSELQEFAFDLRKSKFRRDNLVIPVHFEFGPSNVKKTEKRIRYNTYGKFKIGLGGDAGINLGNRQKLKYSIDGERVKDKIKRNYNTNDFVYGLSGYIGVGTTTLYAKYDLNPIFANTAIAQRNVSLGLRFDL